MSNLDLSKVPQSVTCRNMTNKDVSVSISGTNQQIIIAAGDAVSVLAERSTDLIGYLSQQSDILSVLMSDEAVIATASAVPTSAFSEADADMAHNQASIYVTRVGDTIIAHGKLDSLVAYASTDSSQGTHKWIAFDVDTGAATLTDVTLNGEQLTSKDVSDATAWGLLAGHFIYWAKAEVIAETPRVFTISVAGKQSAVLTFTFKQD